MHLEDFTFVIYLYNLTLINPPKTVKKWHFFCWISKNKNHAFWLFEILPKSATFEIFDGPYFSWQTPIFIFGEGYLLYLNGNTVIFFNIFRKIIVQII